MVEEVVVFKHFVLVADVILGFAGESLFHHVRVKRKFSWDARFLWICVRVCLYIFTKLIARSFNTRSQHIALSSSLEVRVGLLIFDVRSHAGNQLSRRLFVHNIALLMNFWALGFF